MTKQEYEMPTRYHTTKEILDAIAATPKKKEKEAILEANKNNTTLERVCYLANNPYINFFMRKIPAYTKQPAGFGISLMVALKQLSVIHTRQLTGGKASEFLARVLESVEGDDAEVLEKVVLKNLRSGFSVSTINKVWVGLIPVYPCMLAESYNEDNIAKIRYPALIQEKMDGMRVNFLVSINSGKVEVNGRSGKPIMLNGALDKAIIAYAKELSIHASVNLASVLSAYSVSELVLDGELLVVDEKGDILERKIGNGILNKDVLSTDELSRVRFVIWDAIPMSNFKDAAPFEVPYSQRWSIVSDTLHLGSHPIIGLPETTMVNNIEEAKTFFRKMIKLGKEGSVLKNLLGFWSNTRSVDQVKLKLFVEFEMEIVALEEGKNDCLGKLGAFQVKSKDGIISTGVGSGLSMQQREEFWGLDLRGQIITIKSVGITSNSKTGAFSLDLPIFIEVRNEKTEANTFEEIEEMFRLERSLDA